MSAQVMYPCQVSQQQGSGAGGHNKDTPDPPGGEIDRDENGEPTGILRENAAHLVDDVMPEISREELIDSIVKLGSLLLSQGVTAVCDMGNLEPTDYYRYYEEAAQKGFRQSVGIYYMWGQVRDRKDLFPGTMKGPAEINRSSTQASSS